jgi:hypothetical protein
MYIRKTTKQSGLEMHFPLKFIAALPFLILQIADVYGQSPPIEGFLNGKSAVLISTSPGAKPIITWENLGEEIHGALVKAGGDPVAYYELEDIILSEGIQADYATAFSQRLIENIVVITRKENGEVHVNIMPFTQDKNMVSPGNSWSAKAGSLPELKERIEAIGVNNKSRNLLVNEVPEFFSGALASEVSSSSPQFLARNPLNLNMFKLGVPLAGSAGETAFLTTFRYDLLGKSSEQISAEQKMEREGLESIFKEYYPYEVEFLSTSLTDDELIKKRVQFVLMRLEGREGDLMKSMGLEIPQTLDKDRIVIKYYIKFLVRDELYMGPNWDADPNWNTALTNFLKNLGI